ncbi:MAG: toxin-antitoxin system HicB family antitoxin [Nocardioidaceae bacterium]
MELTPYIETLRVDLGKAADAAGPEIQAAAERLALALDPAMRMVLMEALSDAAAEITQGLPQSAVEVRLKGRDPQFVVTATPTTTAAPADESADDAEDEGEAVARITVRIAESLKAKAEDAAAGRGQSLNTWIVQAIRAATRDRGFNIDIDLSNLPFGFDTPRPPSPPRPGRPGRRVQGWAR